MNRLNRVLVVDCDTERQGDGVVYTYPLPKRESTGEILSTKKQPTNDIQILCVALIGAVIEAESNDVKK